jgi:hypothetical protein
MCSAYPTNDVEIGLGCCSLRDGTPPISYTAVLAEVLVAATLSLGSMLLAAYYSGAGMAQGVCSGAGAPVEGGEALLGDASLRASEAPVSHLQALLNHWGDSWTGAEHELCFLMVVGVG